MFHDTELYFIGHNITKLKDKIQYDKINQDANPEIVCTSKCCEI